MDEKKRAATLRPAQLRHLMRVTAATSRHPERDALILLLGMTCAMRVTEIARVLVADVLMPSGQLRGEVSLRAAITKGCRQRCVFMTHPMAIDSLGHYVEHRWSKGHGTELDRSRFRGLSPETTLILTHKGSQFELTTKRRKMVSGATEDYLACDSLQAHVTSLYRSAGVHGCTSHSGRRTFATRLVEQGHDIEVVQRLLGHAELDHTDSYVQPSDATMRAMFTGALQWATLGRASPCDAARPVALARAHTYWCDTFRGVAAMAEVDHSVEASQARMAARGAAFVAELSPELKSRENALPQGVMIEKGSAKAKLHRIRRLIDEFAAIRAPYVACRSGCADCCRMNVQISGVEAALHRTVDWRARCEIDGAGG